MRTLSIGTGITSLDNILQRLRLGDNVVWQVDNLEDYQVFARAFAETALQHDRRVVYIRFAAHAPVIPEGWAIQAAPAQSPLRLRCLLCGSSRDHRAGRPGSLLRL